MRTIIDLPTEQLAELDGLCRREDISRAEAIRRAVAAHLERNRPPDLTRAFGAWRGRRIGGLAHQRALRREWTR